MAEISSEPTGEPRPELTPPSAAAARPAVVVIGVGNALRHDDAAGLEAVRRLRLHVDPSEVAALEQEGEPLGLIDMWEGAGAVVLVDAVHSGGRPGTIHRVDASAESIPVELRSSSSTHAIGVGEAIELARALGTLPARVVVYGVEGGRFDAGSGLTQEVEAVIPDLVEELLREAHGRSTELVGAQTVGAPPFHTNHPEYPPSHRNVYHDNSLCTYGKEIKREHRVSGEGDRPRCERCSLLAKQGR